MNSNELRECPFCGGMAELRAGIDDTRWVYIRCESCPVFVEVCAEGLSIETAIDNAIKVWNRRAGEGAK